MEIYAAQGLTEFVLAAGYKAELVWKFAQGLPAEWSVDVVDTGEDTGTGGRVTRVADRVGEHFHLTYADGLGDVDLAALTAFHLGHPGLMTVTTVGLPSPYGTLEVAGDGRVSGFREKPVLPDHLINAGFFVVDRRALDQWAGDDLERQVLPALADAGQLFAFRHHGFWRSMDTQKDAQELTGLCADGPGPWVPGTEVAPSRS
jgi:glucose-1-phosphate cytidylyltransferase